MPWILRAIGVQGMIWGTLVIPVFPLDPGC